MTGWPEWTEWDLNPRLPPCEGGDLPLIYRPSIAPHIGGPQIDFVCGPQGDYEGARKSRTPVRRIRCGLADGSILEEHRACAMARRHEPSFVQHADAAQRSEEHTSELQSHR